MSNTLPIALTRLSEHITTINSILKKFDPYDHYAACWVTLMSSPECTCGLVHGGSMHLLLTVPERGRIQKRLGRAY